MLVYTNGIEENHWETIRSVLRKLQKAGLYLDLDKCDIFARKSNT